jgi:hypothetical protein
MNLEICPDIARGFRENGCVRASVDNINLEKALESGGTF